VSDRLFDFVPSPHVAGSDPLAKPKYDLVLYVLYLAAIAVGTIGWLWFIVWSVMWSIGL
jgi:hypothetical protein